MATGAASVVCVRSLGSRSLVARSRRRLLEAMAACGGRMPTPASQALRERLNGRVRGPCGAGSVRGPRDRLVGSADEAADSTRPGWTGHD